MALNIILIWLLILSAYMFGQIRKRINSIIYPRSEITLDLPRRRVVRSREFASSDGEARGRRSVRLVSCKFRGTARKSGVHTRTAYKLIPVPPLERRGGGEGEKSAAVKPKKEAVEVEKDWKGEEESERSRKKKLAGGSYYEPGSRSHARASRPLGPANKSPTVTAAAATRSARFF